MAKMIDSGDMTLTLRGGQILPINLHDVLKTLGIPLRDLPIVNPAKWKGIPLPMKDEYQDMRVTVRYGPAFN